MTFSVITKDLIRNVVVPSDGYHKALLLSRQQFDQIKTKSKVKSHAEAKSEIDSARKEQINEINVDLNNTSQQPTKPTTPTAPTHNTLTPHHHPLQSISVPKR